MENGVNYDEIDPTDAHALEDIERDQADKVYSAKIPKGEVKSYLFYLAGYSSGDSQVRGRTSQGDRTRPSDLEKTAEGSVSNKGSMSSEGARIYFRHPSEVIHVPRRSKIRTTLKKVLRDGGCEIPDNFNEWTDKMCYAAYFELANVKKYDPSKHSER